MPILAFAFLLFATSIIRCSSGDPVGPLPDPGDSPATLTTETLVTGLDTPWDLAWGPDDMIWVTERRGVVSRVNPTTGQITEVGALPVFEQSESGLMGMAFHPDFATSSPFVYFAYSYQPTGTIRNRLVRMLWNGASLSGEEILVDDIPGASNHDGSRLAVGSDRLLYMSMGDATDQSLAQDTNTLAGKVLRMNLDGSAASGNPFGSRIYSYGHRNPQGLVFHPVTGDLFVTEHGPSTDDEVNRIEAGGNFGWPNVHGFCDGNISGESAFCSTTDTVEPLAVWTPTVAPAGADFYDSDAIPGWRGSLLFTTLRGRALYRLVLSADGRTAIDQERLFLDRFGRLRDVLVGPNGEFYLATSNRDGRGSPSADDDRIVKVTGE